MLGILIITPINLIRFRHPLVCHLPQCHQDQQPPTLQCHHLPKNRHLSCSCRCHFEIFKELINCGQQRREVVYIFNIKIIKSTKIIITIITLIIVVIIVNCFCNTLYNLPELGGGGRGNLGNLYHFFWTSKTTF